MNSLFRRDHRHRMDVIAVEHVTTVLFSPGDTRVLRRCQCGELDSILLSGRWTLAQVRGKADLDELERIEAELEVAVDG